MSRVAALLKRCCRCKNWLPRTYFCADVSRADGRASSCTPCRPKRIAPGPTQAIRMLKRRLRLAWCRGCEDWMDANLVRAGLCRAHASEYERRRYAEDERFRAGRRQRSASRKRGVGTVPADGREVILEAFDGLCAYCDQPATTWDHIVPVTGGGKTTPGNIVPACASCNSSKKTKDVAVWIESTGRVAKHQLIDRIALANAGFYG